VSEKQEAEGFTAWKAMVWDGTLLQSPQQRTDWRPRQPIQAYCGIAHDLRETTVASCTCGVYARRLIDKELLKYMRGEDFNTYVDSSRIRVFGVLAQVSMWGWVFEGSTGFRTEFAYPKMLLVRSRMPQEAQDRIRELYQVPVVVNDEAFQQEQQAEKAVLASTVYTQAEIQRALLSVRRARAYRRWYHQRKRAAHEVKYWERMVKDAPIRLQEWKDRFEQLTINGPYGDMEDNT
jgi:hypothetical protein